MRAVLALLLAAPPALGLVRPVGLRGAARRGTVVACDGPELVGPAHVPLPPILQSLSHAQEAGLGSAALLGATALSLSLANAPATAKAWLAVWDTQLGPAIGAHHLTLRGWINEGLMAIFFFIVGEDAVTTSHTRGPRPVPSRTRIRPIDCPSMQVSR
eukprot:scaffold80705_cov24-Tisochrysis_lutea.AAC.1